MLRLDGFVTTQQVYRDTILIARRKTETLRAVNLLRVSLRFSTLFGWSQIFPEGFLRFKVLVAVSFVECMRAIANHIRAQTNRAAAFFARPTLATGEKTPSGSL